MEGLNIDSLVIAPVQGMTDKISGFIPTLISALLILIVGWVVANLIRTLLEKLLDTIHFEHLSEKVGLSNVLDKGEVGMNSSEALVIMVYYASIITVLVTGLNALGVGFTGHLIDGVVGYVPSVLAALFVLSVGLIMAGFISRLVRMVAHNVDLPKPDLLEKITGWAIIIFTYIVTLKELGLSFIFEGEAFGTVFMAICFSFALAFGLGGKDAAAKFLKNIKS